MKYFDYKDIPKELQQYFEEVETECGEQWERVVEKETVRQQAEKIRPVKTPPSYTAIAETGYSHHDALTAGVGVAGNMPKSPNITTLGWRPTCDCVSDTGHYYCEDCGVWEHIDKLKAGCPECGETMYAPHQPIPAVVLDPFAGSGTTLMVARKLGRHSIGLDLSAEYLQLARERLQLTDLDEWTHGRKAEANLDDLPLFQEVEP